MVDFIDSVHLQTLVRNAAKQVAQERHLALIRQIAQSSDTFTIPFDTAGSSYEIHIKAAINDSIDQIKQRITSALDAAIGHNP